MLKYILIVSRIPNVINISTLFVSNLSINIGFFSFRERVIQTVWLFWALGLEYISLAFQTDTAKNFTDSSVSK